MSKKRVLGASQADHAPSGLTGIPTPSSSSSASPSSSSSSSLIATEALRCPICNEVMLTLHQLNRHLDDEHSSPSPGSTDNNLQFETDFKNWFKKTVVAKATEIVNSPQGQSQRGSTKIELSASNYSEISNDEGSNNAPLMENASVIPRDHWQRLNGAMTCNMDGCPKKLGGKFGTVNCRKCGKLFCNQHTLFRMKLDRDLNPDPIQGYWSRCCQDCFLSYRQGWNLSNPSSSNLLIDKGVTFKRLRDQKIENVKLEIVTLENRSIKLLQTLKQIEDGHIPARNLKTIEQGLANWVDSSQVIECSICHTAFNFWNRKHHCRVCGLVVCGDVSRGCSMDVPANIFVDIMNTDQEEKIQNLEDVNWTVRLCLNCKQKLFNKRLLFQSRTSDSLSEFLHFFAQVKALEAKIGNKRKVDGPFDLGHVELLGKMERIGKLVANKIDGLEHSLEQGKVKSQSMQIKIDEIKLYKSLKSYIILFLQENLPILRKAQQEKLRKEQKELESQSYSKPAKPKLLKKEIREYREKLMVLNEQKFMVQNLYEDYKKRKKFDDLKSLELNLSDLQQEIDSVQNQLGDNAF
ncbi:hypothetical protein OGAPHI_002854 [Ogataea philodendri]|uniref:FYVE-type domain-containing protein n=1 Tax=Ogataea philodendri TaxID=1378263 RepID=A0A9P8T6K8_9ASCO|nr:uncharacterized protein OGAPHI_002854 [Ogataea philodendri]KAH3667205.1 hypothetical protein OGAPHI_002854 [Ogataea philodendri]